MANFDINLVPSSRPYVVVSALSSKATSNQNKRITIFGDSIVSFNHTIRQNLNKHVQLSRVTLNFFTGATS